MNDPVDLFLAKSPLAKKVHLDTMVVVHRSKHSAADIEAIYSKGKYRLIPDSKQICELEAGGVVIAKGEIVKKDNEWYFKVFETVMIKQPKSAPPAKPLKTDSPMAAMDSVLSKSQPSVKKSKKSGYSQLLTEKEIEILLKSVEPVETEKKS